MRSKTIPLDAEIIPTYDELREFRDSFFNGEFSFLLIVGRPGLSKSWEFEERCRPRKDRSGHEFYDAHYVKGNITPSEAYHVSYEHRNKLLVFDDSERLWAERNGRYLLRDLTECKPWKWVNWRANNKDFERQGIPKSFRTSSRVCLIMNRFAFGDAREYDAIVDRAHFIYFDPTPLEIHKNTAVWFWDQEVFDYVGEHLHLIDPDKLSSRAYVKAYERKAKGDWKESIAHRCFDQSGERWVLFLESNPRYRSVHERVAEFIRRTGLARSSYYNFKKSLKTSGQLHPDGQPCLQDVPRYVLTGRAPEALDPEAEARAAAEENRRRDEENRLKQQEEQEYQDLEDKYFDDEDDEEDED